MDEKIIKIVLVEDAEHYLSIVRTELDHIEHRLNTIPDTPESRRKLTTELEHKRIKFAQIASEVVIFKAKNGIFTKRTTK